MAPRFDCSICASSYTERNKVTCSACSFDTCRNCFQTWVTSTEKDPECMNCKVPVGWEFLNDNTTKTFMNNVYKTHRRNVLLDREKTLIPSTMPLVEREKKLRDIDKFIGNLNAKVSELTKEIRQIRSTINDAYAQKRRIYYGSNEKADKVYNVKCPVDECKGYLNSKHVCSICENKICISCMEIKGEGHQCDPGKVETVRLIKAETKPCPSCGTRIQKTHGCSQMWCVDCKTFFSWTTGEIITRGPLHNPEYLEWMRRNGGALRREIGDEYCGGLPNILVPAATLAEIRTMNTPESKEMDKVSKEIQELTRSINHIQDHMRRFPIAPLDQINQVSRISYLIGDLPEAEFARNLQLNERTNKYNTEIRSIMTLIQEVVTDKVRELITDRELRENRGIVWKSSAKAALDMCKTYQRKVRPELEEFRDFLEQSLIKIGKRYTRKPLKPSFGFIIR